MDTTASVYNAVSNWHRLFYGSSLQQLAEWRNKQPHEWELVQTWMDYGKLQPTDSS